MRVEEVPIVFIKPSTRRQVRYDEWIAFWSKSKNKGVCQPFFSFDNFDKVGIDISGQTVTPTDAEKLCRSGLVDIRGRCTQGTKSIRKGQNCTFDTDCNSTDPNIFAPCKCGHTGGSNRYCDTLPLDDEWQSALNAFQQYYIKTKNCHNAAGWSECDQPELWRRWKCAEAMAQTYVEQKDNPDCLMQMYDQHFIFQGIAAYCSNKSILHFTIGLLFYLVLSAFTL
eukprot:TRINITY_DN3152_c0_g1_i15.p2 TRINITY_DN3152_c0_g1~~TRINITY_DN3152_c0_g1_i15.p2  ORF type:complete len:225 (-),score=16.43 TRINITY_DN3152_c0_g1_i15:511-1185(-)